jgi:hypothetical protein
LTELLYCVTVGFTMTERADQLHRDDAPAHSTALAQAFYGKATHHPDLSAPLQPRFGSLRLLAFPKVKFAVENEDICELGSHSVHIVIHCQSIRGHYLPFVCLPSTFLPCAVPWCKNQLQEDRQCMFNITLRHVYVTTVAVEKQ